MATVQTNTDPKNSMSATFASRAARGPGALLREAKSRLLQELADKGGGNRRKTLGIWMYRPTMDLTSLCSQNKEPTRTFAGVYRLRASKQRE